MVDCCVQFHRTFLSEVGISHNQDNTHTHKIQMMAGGIFEWASAHASAALPCGSQTVLGLYCHSQP